VAVPLAASGGSRGAFRVGLGLLTVLAFASPAVAQNLQGTWRFRSVTDIENRGTICAAGSVTFNAAGAVIAPSNQQECNAAVTSTFAGSFFVQGRAATGVTTITAQAPGYADVVGTVSARPSGFIINSPGNFTTTTGAANTNIQITSARLNPTTLNWETNQAVPGGATGNVTVTATDQTGGPGVGAITTSPLIFNGNAVAVTTQFNPAVAGISQVAVGVPTGFSTSQQLPADPRHRKSLKDVGTWRCGDRGSPSGDVPSELLH
jgi:hypothetical protein